MEVPQEKNTQSSTGSQPKLIARNTLSRPIDTPRELLEKVVTAYRSAYSYTDTASARLVGKMANFQAEPVPWACSVMFELPNYLRLEINEGIFVCDGNACSAQVLSLPDQVLQFSASHFWTLDKIFNDICLDQSMTVGIPESVLRFAPQLVLLFASDPLKTILPEGAFAEFLEPQWLHEIPCDLIRITHPDGNRTLWISRNNFALVRFDYQIESLPVPEGVESVNLLRIDMHDAKFDQEIPLDAFQFRPSSTRKIVNEFEPEVENFCVLSNTEQIVLSPITHRSESASEQIEFSSLTDKTIAILFWTTWSVQSQSALAAFEEAAISFRDDNRVKLFAVNLDDFAPVWLQKEELEDIRTNIRRTLSYWSISLPTMRDVGGVLSDALQIDSMPTLVILGSDGTVEFYFRGLIPSAILVSLIRDVAEQSGEGATRISVEKKKHFFKQQRAEHTAQLKQMSENDLYLVSNISKESSGRETAPVEPPKKFKLHELWKRKATGTGNVAFLSENSAEPEILMPCEGDSLLQMTLTGNAQKIKPVGFRNDEMVSLVRTYRDAAGNDYIGISSSGGRTIHVFDKDFTPLMTYNLEVVKSSDDEEIVATKTQKHILSDFQFVPPDTSETETDTPNTAPNLVLAIISLNSGFTDVNDSVRFIEFDGTEKWRDESFIMPLQVEPTKDGFIVLEPNAIIPLDKNGKRKKGWEIDGEAVAFNQKENHVAVAVTNSEQKSAEIRLFDSNGNLQWSRQLSDKNFQNIKEPICFAEKIAAWIVSMTDGSIFVFDNFGNEIDSFALGIPVSSIQLAPNSTSKLVIVNSDEISVWNIE